MSLSLLVLVACVASSYGMMGGWMHHMPKCEEPYGDWATTDKCLWPGLTTFDDMPAQCKDLPPKPAKMPELPYKLLQAKKMEYFDKWMSDMKDRGIDSTLCGMCGFKARCRAIKNAPTSMHCPIKEKVFIYDDECQKPEPCKLTKKDGMCESPESISMVHMMTAMKAMMKPGGMDEDMKYGMKIEMFMGMMMGMGGGGTGMMSMGMGGMGGHHGKMKGKMGSGPPAIGNPEVTADLAAKITALADSFKGKSKEDIISSFKTLMSQDSGVAKKIQEAMQVFSGILGTRTKRQAEETKLADNESYITPKMNCVSNKANDGCLCCCNWHIPDRDNNKCVNIKDDMIAFMKDFQKDMEMEM